MRTLAVLACLLTAPAALGSERLRLEPVPQQPPGAPLLLRQLPSLILCAGLCVRRADCRAAAWLADGSCTLFNSTSGTDAGAQELVQLYHRLESGQQTTTVTPPPQGTDTGSTTTPEPATTSSPSETTASPGTIFPATATDITTTDPSTSAATPTSTTTTGPTQTSTISVATCPGDFTLVDGKCLMHVQTASFLGFAAFRSHCGTLAAGGDLASVHSQQHLDFLWADPRRSADTQAFLGIEEISDGVFLNLIDNSTPAIGLSSLLTQSNGIYLAVPNNLVNGTLYRMRAGASIQGGVCEAP